MILQEPKKVNQWKASIKGLDLEPWLFRKIDLPSLDSDNQWSNFECEIVDVICPSTTKLLLNKFKDSKKAKVIIDVLDPVGCSIETWKIKCELQLMDFGGLDYGIYYSKANKENPTRVLKTIRLVFSTKKVIIK